MYRIINTGKFYADGGAMFGAVPKMIWRRCYPADENNLCVLSMHAGTVQTPDGRIIVIDPGVGEFTVPSYHFHELRNIGDALRQETGIEPAAVTDVIFTHLHFDHCGGAIADGKPLFENATHWCSRLQIETEQRPHPLEEGSFLPHNTEILSQKGLLRPVSKDVSISEYVDLQLFDGHTPGQIAAFIATDDIKLIFPGDIIPLASHVVLQRISAYDLNPSLSWYSRRAVLERAVMAANAVMVFYHDACMPVGAVRRAGASYKASSLALKR